MESGQMGSSDINVSAKSQNDNVVTHTRIRHTPRQIQQLETFFKEIPRPNEKQRKEIGMALGIDPQRVKFWFQNKRSQLKTKSERGANYNLKMENNRLQAENVIYKETLIKRACYKCGASHGVPSPLKLENIILKNEIRRVQDLCLQMWDSSTMNFDTSVPCQSQVAPPNGEAPPATGAQMFFPPNAPPPDHASSSRVNGEQDSNTFYF